MEYKYKEYTHIFDTPAAKEQEGAIVNKIMDLLNKNKYDNIEEFINKNPNYQDFLKNNELENVMKHFGNTLNEADYTRILESMRQLTKDKKSFDKENIKTTTIGANQYNSYEGEDKTYYFDNTHNGMSLESQLDELQPTQNEFQTNDKFKNTESMMKELEETKKESLNLKYLNEFNLELLNEQQKEVWHAAANYQLNIKGPVKVDIIKEVIVDEQNNIMKIERNNGEITIQGDNSVQNENSVDEKQNQRTLQKSLTPSPNTIYSENN